MNLYVVAVRDRASDVFGSPYFVVSVGAAVRSFGDEINREDAQNPCYKHPEDYDLFLLGSYDDNIGKFVNTDDGPRQIAIGKDLSTRLKAN